MPHIGNFTFNYKRVIVTISIDRAKKDYGVVIIEIDLSQIDELVFDYETNRVLPNSTLQYRDMLVERMVPHWS
jgi:hypothetical protein